MERSRLTLLPQPVADQEISGDIARLRPAVRPEPLPAPPAPPVEIVSLARLAAGGRWRTEGLRSQTRPVLVWVTRGQGRITVAGRTSGYGPHNAIFLPPGTMHGFTSGGQISGSMVFLPQGAWHRWPDASVHIRFREAQLQRELTGMIDAMEREAIRADMGVDLALAHHAGLLAVWLQRVLARDDIVIDQPDTSAARRLVEAYMVKIERDFPTPVGVQDIAADLGVTPTHLSRACREVSGRPALDLLNDRRHYEARRLLLETPLTVAEIAARTGFASAAYFTRAFTAENGLNPTEFRRKN